MTENLTNAQEFARESIEQNLTQHPDGRHPLTKMLIKAKHKVLGHREQIAAEAATKEAEIQEHDHILSQFHSYKLAVEKNEEKRIGFAASLDALCISDDQAADKVLTAMRNRGATVITPDGLAILANHLAIEHFRKALLASFDRDASGTKARLEAHVQKHKKLLTDYGML